jgi:AcrR family transcriptional regulator
VAKGEVTRQRILEAAGEQAAVRGLHAVSLGAVAEAVGLSKSGVFKHFQAKEALQQALIESVTERFVDRVWGPAEPLPEGVARLDMIFERWIDWAEGEASSGGCGLTVFAIDLDDQPGPLRDYLKDQQIRWQKTLAREFAAAGGPELNRDQAWQAAFELKSIVLGYNHSRRLLDDERARGMARNAYKRLLAAVTATPQGA